MLETHTLKMMAAKLGSKRTCPSCGTKFYDLGKVSAVCPKCGYVSTPKPEAKPAAPKRRPAPRPVIVKTEEPKPKQHIDDQGTDIDLSGFVDTAEEKESAVTQPEELEEVDEVELVALEEVEEREREETKANSDDAEEDDFIAEMKDAPILVDKPETDEGEEEEKG